MSTEVEKHNAISAKTGIRIKTLSEIYQTGLTYVKLRKEGIAKSVRTPWNNINQVGVNGFEWNSIITVAGRSGTGKTVFVNELTRNVHRLNPDQDIHVIDFQLEMHDKQIAVREFTSVTGVKVTMLLRRLKNTFKLKVTVTFILSIKQVL